MVFLAIVGSSQGGLSYLHPEYGPTMLNVDSSSTALSDLYHAPLCNPQPQKSQKKQNWRSQLRLTLVLQMALNGSGIDAFRPPSGSCLYDLRKKDVGRNGIPVLSHLEYGSTIHTMDESSFQSFPKIRGGPNVDLK